MMMMMHQVEALLQERGYKFASSSGSGPPLATQELVMDTTTSSTSTTPLAVSRCLLFDCIRQKDSTRVKLKLLLHNNNDVSAPRASFLLPRSLCNFQHEHKIVEQLKEVDGVVKIHERLSAANMEALVMEDFGGECLDEWLRREGPFVESRSRLAEFMELAVGVTKALSQVHAHNIVHKNIQVHTPPTHIDFVLFYFIINWNSLCFFVLSLLVFPHLNDNVAKTNITTHTHTHPTQHQQIGKMNGEWW